MKNLHESIESLNEYYMEMLSKICRMLEINLEMIENGEATPKLYGECLLLEDMINSFEIKIKDESIYCIARFQPTAKDLRQLIMLINGSRLLERMADILKANVKILREIFENAPELKGELKENYDVYVGNIKNIYDTYLEAYSTSNQELLYFLIFADEEIDAETKKITKKIVVSIEEKINGETKNIVENYLKMNLLAKKYERFCDHIMHLVVDYVYVLKGEKLKKQKLIKESI